MTNNPTISMSFSMKKNNPPNRLIGLVKWYWSNCAREKDKGWRRLEALGAKCRLKQRLWCLSPGGRFIHHWTNIGMSDN